MVLVFISCYIRTTVVLVLYMYHVRAGVHRRECQLPLSKKGRNYGFRVIKSGSSLTKFLVNIIHIYCSKIIYY